MARFPIAGWLLALLGGLSAIGMVAGTAQAQLGALTGNARNAAPVSRDAPVTFQADHLEYDRDGALITATGHVEAWQNDRILRADKVTFDRNTNVAAATGHVVLLEPDGQVLFSDYAELTQGMRDGVLRDMRAMLAENGKLAANGARRLEARTNELSRVIYSTCNVCAEHPERPPLWDIRARSAVQDLINKRIEYSDAVVDLYGLPVAYFPYLAQADPSQKRASGFLVPSIGNSTHLGAFVGLPYYWVLDGQSDATFTPIIASNAGPALDLQYRRRFNFGSITVNGSVAYDEKTVQGHVFSTGQFAWDDTWRYGFNINRASSSTYLRDFRVANFADTLTSEAYIEGFGQGSYTKLDARAYQGLTSVIVTEQLPYVLPRYQYSFVGEPDALGGRLSVDAGAFNVIRDVGTSTQRASLRLNWERPATGAFGEVYKFVLHTDGAGYVANGFDAQPNYGVRQSVQSAQAMPTAALEVHWPFAHSGDWGSQIVEPIVQLVGSPNGSAYNRLVNRIPNEDSLDPEFTDANLFSLNRFPGIDRLEGGLRANVALHANWRFTQKASLDGLVGQAYREHRDQAFPLGSGLEGRASDIVSRLTFTPSRYLDLTTRQRFNHHNGDVTFADALVSGGPDAFRLNAGYIYSSVTPAFYLASAPTANVLPGPPRNEITVGASTHYGRWRLDGNVRRDIQSDKMVSLGGGGAYEDECFIFDVHYFRRFTSVQNDSGSTTILFTITLKTVGQFGFHAS